MFYDSVGCTAAVDVALVAQTAVVATATVTRKCPRNDVGCSSIVVAAVAVAAVAVAVAIT